MLSMLLEIQPKGSRQWVTITIENIKYVLCKKVNYSKTENLNIGEFHTVNIKKNLIESEKALLILQQWYFKVHF